MTEEIHKALEALAPHVGEGSQIFIREGGNYHKFRIEGGQVAHRESHSSSHVEQGRGALEPSGGCPTAAGGNGGGAPVPAGTGA